MTTPTLTTVPIDSLHESPFNPRRTFNQASLEELAGDIRLQGILQPITVRPRLADGAWEVVFGHRRLRAAQLVGLQSVPIIARAMTDEEAKRAQISENLSREDVHPIEEGEGFRALMRDHGLTADDLVTQTGKSRSYIYGRIKLAEHLLPSVREACLQGKIGSEVALLLARLRHDKLQEKALGYIKGKYLKLEDGGKESFRRVRTLLQDHFNTALKDAIFDVSDAMLLEEAGSCMSCPKLSGNAPEFEDTAADKPYTYGRTTCGPDVCTDPECFAAKKKKHLALKASELESQGKTVVQGAAARAAIGADGKVKGAYVDLKSVEAAVKKAKVPTVVIQDQRTGKTVKAVRQADLIEAGLIDKPDPATKGGSRSTSDNEARRALAEQRSAMVTKRNVALFHAVRSAWTSEPPRLEHVRMCAAALVWAMTENWDSECAIDVPALHGASNPDDLINKTATMDGGQCAVLMLDLIASEGTEYSGYGSDDVPKALRELSELHGIPVQTPAPDDPPEPASTPSEAARAAEGAAEGADAAEPVAEAKPKAKGKAKKPKAPAAGAAEKVKDEPADAGGGDAIDLRCPRTIDMLEEAGHGAH